MLLKTIRCAAVAALAATLAQGAVVQPGEAPQPQSTMLYGIGQRSCANWLSSPETESEGQTWILGYWSGLNFYGSSHLVGANSDAPAIYGEVKKICIAEPSTTLLSAIMRVYNQFKATGK